MLNPFAQNILKSGFLMWSFYCEQFYTFIPNLSRFNIGIMAERTKFKPLYVKIYFYLRSKFTGF